MKIDLVILLQNIFKREAIRLFPLIQKQNKKFLKKKVYSSILDLNFIPDMVDIFIRSEKVLPVVEDALKVKPKTIWLQLGVYSKEAEKKVKTNINFVMDRCPKIEYARLNGELSWGGINTEIITSKKMFTKLRKKNKRTLGSQI